MSCLFSGGPRKAFNLNCDYKYAVRFLKSIQVGVFCKSFTIYVSFLFKFLIIHHFKMDLRRTNPTIYPMIPEYFKGILKYTYFGHKVYLISRILSHFLCLFWAHLNTRATSLQGNRDHPFPILGTNFILFFNGYVIKMRSGKHFEKGKIPPSKVKNSK